TSPARRTMSTVAPGCHSAGLTFGVASLTVRHPRSVTSNVKRQTSKPVQEVTYAEVKAAESGRRPYATGELLTRVTRRRHALHLGSVATRSSWQPGRRWRSGGTGRA